jgi:hypothetical protein
MVIMRIEAHAALATVSLTSQMKGVGLLLTACIDCDGRKRIYGCLKLKWKKYRWGMIERVLIRGNSAAKLWFIKFKNVNRKNLQRHGVLRLNL